MKLTRTFYNRLVSAFIFTTFIISGLYGVLVFNGMKYTEDDILNRRLELEAKHYITQYIEDKKTARLPNSIGLYSYLSSSPEIPAWLKEQPLGSRELHDKELHVGVSELPNDDGLLYIVLSELESSSLESELASLFIILLSVGAVITVIGLIVGVILGKYITDPLITLTNEIELFDSSDNEQRKVTFYGSQRTDEVGALSRAFTRLVERLGTFLEREKEFTRHASHELRTPLSIIYNSLAILNLPESTAGTQKRNLHRIENATIEMDSLINTFLYLGRDKQTTKNENVNVSIILQRSLEKHAYLDENQRLHIIKNIASDIIITNESNLVQVLFDNIIRNMFAHSGSKSTITLTKEKMTVENDLKTSDYDDASIKSFGKKIIERISEYCNLKVIFHSTDIDFKVTVIFNKAFS